MIIFKDGAYENTETGERDPDMLKHIDIAPEDGSLPMDEENIPGRADEDGRWIYDDSEEDTQPEDTVMKMEIRYKEAENPEEQKSIDMVKGIIEDAFESVGITKHEGDTYIGNGDGKDYVSFGKVSIDMMKSAAILSCVDTWLFYDEDGDVEDFGTKSKKDLGLLPPNAPDRSKHKEIKLSVMKMEIRYKETTNKSDQQAQDNLKTIIDRIFADCGFTKKDGDFYIGNDDKNDYAHFGMVFQALNDWNIFLESVDVWNFYDEYGEAEDYATPCKKRAGVI